MKRASKKFPSEYFSFIEMRQRCNNPKNSRYYCYGARGIKVVYNDFEEFFNDVGPRPTKEHSIDRIDNNRNYQAGNCRWATRREQAINRSDNLHITYNDETLTLIEWSEKLGFNYKLVQNRLQAGWTTEHSFNLPITPMGGDYRRALQYKGE